jgi:hypothetical protein
MDGWMDVKVEEEAKSSIDSLCVGLSGMASHGVGRMFFFLVQRIRISLSL